MAGIAERQAANQTLGGILGQQRGQDLQASAQNRQLALQGYGTIEQQRGNRFNALTGVPTPAESGIGAGMGVAQLIAGTQGGGGGGGGAPFPAASGGTLQHMGLAGLSDMRAKENIRGGDAEARRMLDALRAFTYKYKPEAERLENQRQARTLDVELGPAKVRPRLDVELGAARVRPISRPTRIGVMAQHLERSPLGAQAVVNTPAGKAIDPAQLSMGLAAGLANLNSRMKKIEKE
jgi:hypothetical protein